MKPYVLGDREYTDLNSLGIDFASNLGMALEAIKQKAFLRFVKKFKNHKKDIIQIMYETRYLQNALTFIIYSMTEDHILIIGKERYFSFKDLYKDLKKNPAMEAFIRERGFSKTILSTIEDEKLRQNLMALENDYNDSFAVNFIYNYYEYDELDSLETYINPLLTEERESYKKALHLFQEEDFLLYLGHKFLLKDILEIKKRNTPVFAGVKLLVNELPIEKIEKIIQPEFCLQLLENIKCYKYKSSNAKFLRYKLKKFQKKIHKKKEKFANIEQKIDYYEDLFLSYLEFVDLFKKNEILCKDKTASYEPMFPYCDTYVWEQYIVDKLINPDKNVKEYVPIERKTYDLKKLAKSLRNHKFFAVWLMVFALGVGLYYPIVFLVDYIQKSNTMHMPEDPSLLSIDFSSPVNMFCIIGICLALAIAIFILGIRFDAKSKYNGLCRLCYYRNNESILVEAQWKDYEILKTREKKYATRIDRFYRFYGCFGMFALSTAIASMVTALCYDFAYEIYVDLVHGAYLIESQMLYILFIPACVVFLLGLLRQRKTSWSIIFTFLFSLIGSLCLIYFISRV